MLETTRITMSVTSALSRELPNSSSSNSQCVLSRNCPVAQLFAPQLLSRSRHPPRKESALVGPAKKWWVSQCWFMRDNQVAQDVHVLGSNKGSKKLSLFKTRFLPPPPLYLGNAIPRTESFGRVQQVCIALTVQRGFDPPFFLVVQHGRP